MPSQVPAGYTRGALNCTGAVRDPLAAERLLQLFWEHGGGYGARLLVLARDEGQDEPAERYAALFTSWECDSVRYGRIADRAAARSSEWPAAVEASTGVLLLAAAPLQVDALLGGTPLAQAVRRANARGRAVAAIGLAAPALCQHMLVSEEDAAPSFAPGLGLVNRLTVVVQAQPNAPRLLAAVAYNPFLIAVGVPDDSAVALYADSTLEAFGAGPVTLVDGDEISYSAAPESGPGGAAGAPEVVGAATHLLKAGYTFNLDSRTVAPPPPTDIPSEGPRVTSAY